MGGVGVVDCPWTKCPLQFLLYFVMGPALTCGSGKCSRVKTPPTAPPTSPTANHLKFALLNMAWHFRSFTRGPSASPTACLRAGSPPLHRDHALLSFAPRPKSHAPSPKGMIMRLIAIAVPFMCVVGGGFVSPWSDVNSEGSLSPPPLSPPPLPSVAALREPIMIKKKRIRSLGTKTAERADDSSEQTSTEPIGPVSFFFRVAVIGVIMGLAFPIVAKVSF